MTDKIKVEITPEEQMKMMMGAYSSFYTSMSYIYCKKRIPTFVQVGAVPKCINGTHIQMPLTHVLANYIEMNKVDHLRALFDDFAHECFHVVDDTYSSGVKLSKEVEMNTWSKHVHNVVEDARIDWLRGDRYPGMKITIAWINDNIYKYLREDFKDVKDVTDRAFDGLLQIQDIGKIKGSKHLRKKEREFFKKAKILIDHARKEPDADKRLTYTQIIIDEGLKIGVVPPPEKKVASRGFEITLTNDPNMKGDGNSLTYMPDSVREKIEKALKDFKQQDISDNKTKKGDPSSSAKEWHGIKPDKSLDSTEQDSKLSDAMDETIRNYAVNQDREDILKNVSNNKRQHRRSRKGFDVNKVIGELDSFLRRIKYKIGRKNSKRGRKIDTRKWIRYKCGATDQDFYWLETNKKPGDRSICIAIDMSSSMNGRIEEASKAAYVMSYVAEMLEDKVCVLGYQQIRTDVDDIVCIKNWNDKLNKQDFESITADGCTPTPFAIKTALHFLEVAPKPKKLLVVVEDGGPNVSIQKYSENGYPGFGDEPDEQTRQMIDLVKKRNVKVLGIYIGGSKTNQFLVRRMEEFYGRNNFIIIPNINYLAKELFRFYRREMGITRV